MNPNNPYNMYTPTQNIQNVFAYNSDLSGSSSQISSGYNSLNNSSMNSQLVHSMAASFSSYDSSNNSNNFANLLPTQQHFHGQAPSPAASSNDYTPKLKHKKAKIKKIKLKNDSGEESDAEADLNDEDNLSNEVYIQSQQLTDFIKKGGIRHNETDNFQEINQLPMFQLNSRILIKSDKTIVSVGEIFRRTNPPESMNTSVLSCLLRKAKTTTMGKELRQCLEQVNINVPSGRRKGVSNNAFTALTECDTLRIAQDFGSLAEKYLVMNNLCEIFPKPQDVPESLQQLNFQRYTQEFLIRIQDMWSQGDALAMESNEKIDAIVAQRDLPVLKDFVNLSRATHRFDFHCFDVIIKILLDISRHYEAQIKNKPEVASFIFQHFGNSNHVNFQPMSQISHNFQENIPQLPPTDLSLFYQQHMDLLMNSQQQQQIKVPLQQLRSQQQLNDYCHQTTNSTIPTNSSTEGILTANNLINTPKLEGYTN